MSFAASPFVPFALGFFGLGTGYLIYGPQELFGWPKRDERVDAATGIWGIWMPGACQLLAGIILFIGMSWFQVFKEPVVYMAALAFTAYGIHWLAIGSNRQHQRDPRPNAGMCVAYFIISVLGVAVFFTAGDVPVALLFIGLALIYFFDFFASIGLKWGEKGVGLWHLATGLWLMYLMIATVYNLGMGAHMWL